MFAIVNRTFSRIMWFRLSIFVLVCFVIAGWYTMLAFEV